MFPYDNLKNKSKFYSNIEVLSHSSKGSLSLTGLTLLKILSFLTQY